MRGGKGNGWTTKGFAPHREKGMLMVRQRSQLVRVLPAPAEPISLTKTANRRLSPKIPQTFRGSESPEASSSGFGYSGVCGLMFCVSRVTLRRQKEI